jgi:EAL domain-containing protein (putative c-di-GMP-specific phosphodiesterase class I)
VYQPQADIVTRKIIGYEALIRWEDPEWGRMSPVSFIPIAEKTGQIIPIGNWVLETACAFARKMNQDRQEPLIVSVNISPVQLMQYDFFETVVSIIDKMNVPPFWIGLEITETSLISSLQQKADVLSRLQQMGFHIILDDFGTGYSSLHYLRDLPIEIMKIDQTFTNKLGVTKDNDDLMCLIIEVAHLLKINVVAEGVETIEQLEFLALNHCDSIQGYYFSHPLPEDEIFRQINNPELE